MVARVLYRVGTSTLVDADTYILADGELGWDDSNNVHKVGNGVDKWSDLPEYVMGSVSGGGGDTEPVSWDEVIEKPAEFPPAAHGHTWGQISEKPTEFPPAAHGHAIEGVAGLQAALNSKGPAMGAFMDESFYAPTGTAELPTITREGSGYASGNTVMWNSAGFVGGFAKGAYLVDSSTWGFNDPSGTGLPNQYMLDFWHNGASFALRLSPSASINGFYQMWVNGHPVTENPVFELNTDVGVNQWLKATFSGGVKIRRIQVMIGGYNLLHSIQTPAAERVHPALSNPLKFAMIGDSFTQANHTAAGTGTSATTVRPVGIPVVLSRITGFEVFSCGAGSTGYKAGDGTGIHFGGAARLARFAQLPANLDGIIIFGSSNDVAAGTAAQMAANATALFQALKAARPNTPIIVVGPQGVTITDAQLAEYTLALKNAALAESNVVAFIDTQNPSKWLTGTSGNATAPAGNGNRDIFIGSDNAHPSADGNRYLARRIAQAARGVVIQRQAA